MKIDWRNVPLAGGITVGAIILHQILYSFGFIVSFDPVSNVFISVFFAALFLLPFSHVFRVEKFETVQFYIDSFTLSMFLIAFVLLLSPYTAPVFSAMLLLYCILTYRQYGKNRSMILRSVVYSVSFILLLAVAGIIRFNVYNPPFSYGAGGSIRHIIVFSIYNNENPLGVPFYLADGVVIQGISSVLTVSFQSILIYAVISAFLTENYYLIVSYVLETRKGIVKGAASAVSTALSCQCETISAALPSFSVLFLSIASILLLSEGFAVLLFTYIIISRIFKKGKEAAFMKMEVFRDRLLLVLVSFAMIVAIPVIEILGIEFNMIGNLLFLLGTGILMFSEGAVIIYLVGEVLGGIRVRERLYVPFIILSTAGMFVWYFPSLLLQAGTVPAVFLFMNATSLLSGALAALLYLSMNRLTRKLLVEYTLMMFNMAAIVIFYYSVVRNYVIWPYFGLAQQTVFSIILVAVSLPLTVYNTNMTLNSYATPTL